MKALTLRIKKEYFYAILNGEKTTETREVKPTTASRLVFFTHKGKTYRRERDLPNDDAPVSITPVHYDRLLLINGYHANAPRLTVEVKKADFFFLADENGEDVTYMYNGEKYHMAFVEYTLGKVLSANDVEK